MKRFTLVELLICLSVIGILAALLLPALNLGKSRALKTSCMSNLRQIGHALEGYLADNRYMLPYCAMSISSPSQGEEDLPGIADTLSSYTGGKADVFKCPADNAGFFEREKSSYEWAGWLGINGQPVNEKTLEITLGGFTYKKPLMYDYDNFHGSGARGKNYLYFPLRVTGTPDAD